MVYEQSVKSAHIQHEEERKARPHFLREREQVQLSAELAVIATLGLLDALPQSSDFLSTSVALLRSNLRRFCWLLPADTNSDCKK